jgi:hypothetical protein
MSILLIIAIIAAFVSLVLNAYNYFGDRSLRHLYRATDYTSQSALNKAVENGRLIDAVTTDYGYVGAKVSELDSRITAMKTYFDGKLNDNAENISAIGRKLADLTAKLNDSLENGDVVAKEIHKSLSILHTRQLEYTAKLAEIEAYINPPTAVVLPEPNEDGLKQEMYFTLAGGNTKLADFKGADVLDTAVENTAPERTPCETPCGTSWCDEYGCDEFKPVVFDAPSPDPTPAPTKQRRKNGK